MNYQSEQTVYRMQGVGGGVDCQLYIRQEVHTWNKQLQIHIHKILIDKCANGSNRQFSKEMKTANKCMKFFTISIHQGNAN